MRKLTTEELEERQDRNESKRVAAKKEYMKKTFIITFPILLSFVVIWCIP